MKASKHFLLFFIFAGISILSVCTGPIVQTKKPVDCSLLLMEAKNLLIENKEHLMLGKQTDIEKASFEFSKNHKCASTTSVIFGLIVHLKYFDTSVNATLCGTFSLNVLAERLKEGIAFIFEDAVIVAFNVCESSLEKGGMGWEGGIGQ